MPKKILTSLSREGLGISSNEYRINRQIRAREVRLIDDANDNIGVVTLARALEMAEERELDLVEVAPNADPPVCRIMDFGKFQYEKQRRERKARKTQKTVEVKQIRMGPTTDEFHMGIMITKARGWLEEGMKVRFSIKFRGRQNLHTDIGRQRLKKIAEALSEVATVEQSPNLEGNQMSMTLTPGGTGVPTAGGTTTGSSAASGTATASGNAAASGAVTPSAEGAKKPQDA